MHKSTLLAILFFGIIAQVFAQPVITSFNPASGPVGTTVTITGANFNTTAASNSVYFGAVKATVTAATSTSLTVTAPVGATYKPITVTTGGLTAYSSKPFKVTFPNSGHILPGSFAAKVDVGTNVSKYCVADLDGDGRSDIITGRGGTDLSVFRNISSVGAVQFSSGVTTVAVRAGANGVATGDLDMDGKLDVAVACNGDGTSGVSLLRNYSSPGIVSLGNRLDLVSSIYSHCDEVVIHDFDGDGKSDVAVYNSSSIMSVFRNTNTTAGIFSFASAQNYTLGGGAGNITTGDIDGDGKPDIVACQGSINTGIDIFRNTSTPGTISFAASTLTTPPGPISAAIDDFDHDGTNDLAVAFNASNQVSIYKGTSTNGNISFDPLPVTYALADSPRDMAIDDVDGDGLTDLVITNYFYTPVMVFRHASDANTIAFETPAPYAGNTAGGVTRIADMDRDGTPDLLIGGSFTGTASIFLNTVQKAQLVSMNPVYGGPGTEVTINGYNFTNASAVQFGSTAVSSFTVVSDSVIKAVVANGPSGGTIKITTPYGTATGLNFAYSIRTTINYFSPLYGDTNTVVTIVGANFNTTPASNLVYFGDVKATVLTAAANMLTVKVPAGATYKPISVNNGQSVAYSAQPFTPVFPGAPAAFLPTSFDARKNFATGGYPGGTYTTDLDGDGKTDVIVCNGGDNTISVFRNTSTTGVINLAARTNFAVGASPAYVVAADFDRDGKPDLAVGNFSGFSISILKNTSTPGVISFAPKIDISGLGYSGRLAINDINHDGYPDIVAINNHINGTFYVLQNSTYSVGDPITFIKQGNFATGSYPFAVVMNDLNYDGYPEVISSNNSDDNIIIYKNNGGWNLSLTNLPLIATGDGPSQGLEVNDLNNDSLADIVNVNSNSNTVSILQNTTSGSNFTFTTPVFYSTPASPTTLTLGALSGNNKPDMFVNSSTGFSLFRNNSTAPTCSMQPAVNYNAGNGTYSAAISDLDLDGKPDIIVCNNNYSNTISVYRNKINEAIVTPSGTSPVSGDIVSRVTIDPTVQTTNGIPYVQRHYDIEPVTNPATSTATITLYFTQQEFDNYNAHPVHGTNLPGSPTDNANKANLRIFQYHGISATSTPNTYSGGGVEIDPNDNNIVWNATAQWWEVTFDITGFSGFFAGSAGNTILPLNLLSIKGHKQNNQAIVEWTTSDEQNVSHFTVQRSTNGRTFAVIGQVPARNSNSVTTYRYTDELGTAPVYYYRIQIIDKDNHSTNSKVVTIETTDQEGTITIAPNPAKGRVSIVHPEATAGAQLLLIDMSGKRIRTIIPVHGSIETFISTTDLTSGIYKIILQTQGKSYSNTLMVQ